MSNSTASTSAPWKKLFSEHLEKIGGASAEFTLATVTHDGLPQVRYCIHRGFWASLPDNKHNELSKNPSVYESDCPTFTTDARMSKVFDIFATGKGKGSLEQSKSGSGGGGPIEAVYWVKDVMTQWRIKGKCWIVSFDDVEGDDEQNSGTLTVKAEVGRYMRPVGEHQARNNEWSWKREIENNFENLSPAMRGSFKNPPPGQPIKTNPAGPGEALGQKAGHLSDEPLARKNFRVAIITPEKVEAVDLSNPDEATRTIWTLTGEAEGPGGAKSSTPVGEWTEIKTWP